MAQIFIGGAWPYANGSLHLGRVAGILPGDVLARYHRAKGDRVLYVSGSDCHGTPVAVSAAQEGVAPEEVAGRFHAEFAECFRQLGFSYDWYTRTDQAFHHKGVQELFLRLLENGYLYPQTVSQAYCVADQRFLPDRYVEGRCPVCGAKARGDQCEQCSALLDPAELLEPVCKLCGQGVQWRQTEHYFLALSKFQTQLEAYTAAKSTDWRENAVCLTRRYLTEGLQDRAATRDLDWGVDVPLPGTAGKKIYVWIEAVSGYWTASRQWAEETGGRWEDFWLDGAEADGAGPDGAYYVHGKDNVPFHTLIWPALLLGAGGLHLPDRIIASEYLTLEGRKFSTSSNWAVWVPDLLKRYDPDSIRYYLIANGPEKRDANFTWREFIHSHNGELLGAWGNFVNRTLAFIAKSFGGRVPPGELPDDWKEETGRLYAITGERLEEGRLKEALEGLFAGIREANKYFDGRKPWAALKENPDHCSETLYVCVQWIANFANLLEPFLPFSCARLRNMLSLTAPQWQVQRVEAGRSIGPVELLFQRIDPSRIQEEEERLAASLNESS
ncbi:methionine--tRNA ligase [Paenibacillus sp. YN15]|uniref:methionine--tRNA ligase n=1 Tax=Paenibacillus sp. YN15 TaxID=1742774 RepID=UPI000DCBC2C5|nr:methionine--tRNA ligase [Paenibacillus sp. YN15]RAV05632.1 methionine--tRNA ligase [Paenibacillus sp. YN15]